MTTYQSKTVHGNLDVKPDQQEVVPDRHCFHCIHPVYTYLIQLNVSHISLSLFSFLSILFRRAQNALKKISSGACLPIHKSDYCFWFIPTQKRNNVWEAKRRQQEKHSWCVIKAWRKTQFENIWHGGLGQTAASWQIWVTFSDPYKVLEGILSTWIHSHNLLNREGIKNVF